MLLAALTAIALCTAQPPPRPIYPNAEPIPSGGRQEMPAELASAEFSTEPLEAALKRAIKEHKMLVLVFEKIESYPNRRNWWDQPVVAAWVRWHAVVIKAPPTLKPSDVAMTSAEKNVGFQLYVNGKRVYIRDNYKPLWAGRPVVTALYFLEIVDLALQSAKARDPIWGDLHDRDNPPPPKPDAPPPLFTRSTEDALPPFTPPVAINGQPPDVLQVLLDARASIVKKDAFHAVNPYSWLWEAGADADPAFGPFRTLLLPNELREVATSDKVAHERFMSLRDRAAETLLWADQWERLEWLAIGRATLDDTISIMWLDEEINDGDNAAMMTRTDFHAYNQTFRALANASWRDGRAGLQRAKNLAAKRVPQDVAIPDTKIVQSFMRKLALYEACRVYALLLKSSDEPRATEAADLAISIGGPSPGDAHRMLVATALAMNQPRLIHSDWLRQAATLQRQQVESDPLWKHASAKP